MEQKIFINWSADYAHMLLFNFLTKFSGENLRVQLKKFLLFCGELFAEDSCKSWNCSKSLITKISNVHAEILKTNLPRRACFYKRTLVMTLLIVSRQQQLVASIIVVPMFMGSFMIKKHSFSN